MYNLNTSSRQNDMETQPLLPCRATIAQSDAQCTTESRTAFYGLTWITFSAMLVAVPTVAVRLAVTRYDFPPGAAAFIRCLVQLILSTVSLFGVVKVSPLDLSPLHRTILFVRGLCGSIGLILVYISTRYLQAGVLTSISAFSPVLTMLLSQVFLKESSSMWDVGCALVGICGVALIAGPSASKQDILGVVLAFVGACFSAAAYVCVRGMGTSVHFMLSVFALGAVGVPVTAMYGGREAILQMAHNHEGVAVALVGSLVGFVAHCFLNKGLQLCKAGEGIIMKNAQVPCSYLLGMLILGEKPSLLRLVGSMLVVSAVITVGLRRLRAC